MLKPLSHPSRLLVVTILSRGGARSARTLARILGLSQSATFKHLYELMACGLVVSEARANRNRWFSIPTEHLGVLLAIVTILAPLSGGGVSAQSGTVSIDDSERPSTARGRAMVRVRDPI
ncbi:ArsR family transcriptional regulator [Ensifer adhaerens]|nr:ArsR family transcriptional regulator [Ensifer adhaerens]UAY04768.1 ArsR family transcriptional regulator [Ensifer adhaerens]UAY10199.1 ArsR family transcriptional regulator [Ensifer adhaerens]